MDAVFTALENNPTVTIGRLDVDIRRSLVSSQRASFYPELSATFEQSETDAQRRVGSLREPVSVTDERKSYEVGLSAALPTGTRLEAGLTLDGSVSSLYTDQYSGRTGVTVTQALLEGGWGAGFAELKQAKLDWQLSINELRALGEHLVFEVEEAYWNLHLAARTVAIQEASLQLARRQEDETRQRIAVGKLPELELAASRAEVATREVELLEARRELSRAQLNMAYLINRSDYTGRANLLLPVDEPSLPADSLAPLDDHLALGDRHRPDLLTARLQVEKGQVEVKQTRNGLLPRLDLFITLGRSAYAESFSGASPDLDSPYRDVGAGLTFTLPVPPTGKFAQHRRSALSLEQRKLSLDNMERLVGYDIRGAFQEVELARERIRATRALRELQEQNYAAELEKFRVGKSINLQVSLVQRSLTGAQLAEERARVALLTSIAGLYLSEGTLLMRRGLESFE